MSIDQLKGYYQLMHLIRRTEVSLLDLFSRGYLRGTVHTSIGQEACAVGVISNLDKEIDLIYSNHRCHGHYIAYSNDIKGLIAEIMGKEDGVCKGVGGSQHLQYKNFYSNGIQGAGMPVITGMALAGKIEGKKNICVIFVGDGTFGEGSVYEALNIMSLWGIPVLIVVENNRYAQTTPIEIQLAGSFKGRAEAFGIHFSEADGMDVIAVSNAAADCIFYVRDNQRPCMLLLNTYRFAPHSKGDDFRNQSEIDLYKTKDPLKKLAEVIDSKIINDIEKFNESRLLSIIDQLIEA